MQVVITLSPRDYDAVLFDLDGVLTRTATVHASAWKKLFDGFLMQRATRSGEPFVPFDIDADYPRYVDGKSRYDGVAAFLKSREIELPLGTFEDGPEVQSIHGLGNLKDRYFLEHLEQEGVDPYETSVALVRKLRSLEIKTAVVSSSNNCAAVLEAAGITRLFDARVDGTDITRLGLKGKPAPDAFLEAGRRVGVEPLRAVVVEDAIVGVQAGRAGRFGCVIGVDRSGHAMALRDAGADVVVTDLAQVQVAMEPPSPWSLAYEGFDPSQEGIREALCTLGNGYFATRGAPTGAIANDIHYPGTYLAGGYDRLRTTIAGRVVEGEDLVNFPNWLALEFRIAEQNWFDARSVKLLSYHQELDLRNGMLLRSVSFEDTEGRRSTLRERRLISMASMHLGALELMLTADNWSAAVAVRSAIDGRVVNAGGFRTQVGRGLESACGGGGDPCVRDATSDRVAGRAPLCETHRHRVAREDPGGRIRDAEQRFKGRTGLPGGDAFFHLYHSCRSDRSLLGRHARREDSVHREAASGHREHLAMDPVRTVERSRPDLHHLPRQGYELRRQHHHRSRNRADGVCATNICRSSRPDRVSRHRFFCQDAAIVARRDAVSRFVKAV